MTDAPIQKPEFGSPCNGCGLCCIAEQCLLSIEIFGEMPGPCQALEFDEGRFYCGVLRKAPYVVQPIIAYALGIGAGCDSEEEE